MAVSKVRPGEIVEVPFLLPGGEFKTHPALVVSPCRLQNDEDGLFYAVLISTKNHNPQYTIELKNDWLSKPMLRQSYFVTHIMSFFKVSEVLSSHNVFLKAPYFDKVLGKTFYSIFDVEVEF
ncbi:MAG: type II toxin-antitoxin system PemK/MazF family toxin [Prevotella sp.]|nr:type II toxin-antitoxin system PemK/MazF family toxin [Prevotella sp.]